MNLDGAQALWGLRRPLRRREITGQDEDDVLAVGVELSRGLVGLPVAHQGPRGALGNVQSIDQIVETRLAQRSVKPEEVPTFAQRRHALSLFALEPIEDLRHASRRVRSWQDGFCGGEKGLLPGAPS